MKGACSSAAFSIRSRTAVAASLLRTCLWGLGFRVLGLRVLGLLRLRVWGLGFRV